MPDWLYLLMFFGVAGIGAWIDEERKKIHYRPEDFTPSVEAPPALPSKEGEREWSYFPPPTPLLPHQEAFFPPQGPFFDNFLKLTPQSDVQNDRKARQKELEARLEADGCLELLDLIYATPIRLVGKQRSGKSELAKVLCLLRCIYIKGHTVEAWSPNDESKEKMDWPSNFRVFGLSKGRADYSQISSRISAFIEALASGDRNTPTSYIWDEFGAYGAEIDGDLILKALRMALQMSDKHQRFVIVILHGKTNAFLSAIKGLQAALNDFPTIVRKRIKKELGKRVPSPEFTLFDPDEEGEQERTFYLPDWLTSKYLVDLFPELGGVEIESEIKSPEVKPDNAVERLNRLFNASPDFDDYDADAPLSQGVEGELFNIIRSKIINLLNRKDKLKAYEIKSAVAELKVLDRDTTDDFLYSLMMDGQVIRDKSGYWRLPPHPDGNRKIS